MIDILVMAIISIALVAIVMFLFWILYLFANNISIVDIVWGLCFILTALVGFVYGDGDFWRKALLLFLVSASSLRLMYHLTRRYEPALDDPRYHFVIEPTEQDWLSNISSLKLRVLIVFLAQGLIAVLLSTPFFIIANNPSPYFTIVDMVGLLVWGIGLVGETVADNQLFNFKHDPDNKGKVMQQGLWNYSRHPNYFFQFVLWIGYFLLALSSPWGVLAIISPILILFLLLKVSGVPLNEAEAIKSKGDGYRLYQKTTSVFIPWFKARK